MLKPGGKNIGKKSEDKYITNYLLTNMATQKPRGNTMSVEMSVLSSMKAMGQHAACSIVKRSLGGYVVNKRLRG